MKENVENFRKFESYIFPGPKLFKTNLWDPVLRGSAYSYDAQFLL
jgi:hypothetical protein